MERELIFMGFIDCENAAYWPKPNRFPFIYFDVIGKKIF